MGKGSNPLAPFNKVAGKLSPSINMTNKYYKKETGIDLTRYDEGLQKEPEVVYLSNGTSSREVATGSSGTIKKIYDKKDSKK